jgi:hypothetical protein
MRQVSKRKFGALSPNIIPSTATSCECEPTTTLLVESNLDLAGATSQPCQEIMMKSRIIVAASVFLAAATPLFLLSYVTHGVRCGILTKIHDDADVVFPRLARILWIFGPLDLWSYLTPLALAVGAAARIRTSMRLSGLSAILGFSVIQSLLIYGAFQPFANLGSVTGYPPPAPYPIAALTANIVMLLGAVLFALVSILRSPGRVS